MVLRFAGLAVLALAGTLGAQEPTKLPARAPTKSPSTAPGARKPLMTDLVAAKRGWLGFRTDPDDSEIIFEVAAGSPAERAGIRPGDRIVSSDRLSQPIVSRTDSAVGAFPAGSRMYVSGPIMGRTYEMTLARGGETFSVSMVAVAPPDSQRALRPTRAPGAGPDTLQAEVDAFRTELARTTLQPSRKLSTTSPRWSDSLRTGGEGSGIRKSQSHDDRLRLDSELSLEGVKGRRDVQATTVDSPELYESVNATLRKLDRTAVTLDRRTNAISGAEFEQLNPALGQYFGGVSEGIFVLRVGGESPAAIAGLEPGDIVERVNGEQVLTIRSLRERVAAATGTITLEVIRKGRPATVTLRKE